MRDRCFRPVPAVALAPTTNLALPAGRLELARVSVGACQPGGYVALAPAAAQIQRPIGMPDQGSGFLEHACFPNIEISDVRDCICVPGGVILKDDVILLESFSAPWEADQHRHLSREGERWRLVDRGHATCDADDVVDAPTLFLDHQHVAWFGHFMLDLMTRAWAYEFCRAFLRMPALRVVCSADAPSYASTYFEAAGIGREDVLFIDRPTRFRSLQVATKALQIQQYTTPAALRLWQGIFHRVVTQRREMPRRVYVSRRANPTRWLAEEAQVERLFVAHGFVSVVPEALPLRDQMALFGHADLLAGCSGSNMFNLAYARRARSAFILVSPLLAHYQEQFLATGLSLSIRYLIGTADPNELAARPGYVHCTWHIDLAILSAQVDAWLLGL